MKKKIKMKNKSQQTRGCSFCGRKLEGLEHFCVNVFKPEKPKVVKLKQKLSSQLSSSEGVDGMEPQEPKLHPDEVRFQSGIDIKARKGAMSRPSTDGMDELKKCFINGIQTVVYKNEVTTDWSKAYENVKKYFEAEKQKAFDAGYDKGFGDMHEIAGDIDKIPKA